MCGGWKIIGKQDVCNIRKGMKPTSLGKDYFEQIAAEFTAKVAASASEELKSVIFSSPLSARNSDLCMLWHPVYRNRNRTRLIVKLLISIFLRGLKGLAKFVYSFNRLGYAISGRIKSSILVVPSICASQVKDGGFKTAYVSTDREDGMFVLGPVSSLGDRATRIPKLVFKRKLFFLIELTNSGMSAFSSVKGELFGRVVLLLEWLSWVWSFEWLYVYYLDCALSQTLEKYGISRVGCIHEMHAYSRTIWIVAARYKAKGFTVQHASISAGKRWYFPYPEEINSGLILPDVMYIYNHTVSDILKPYYENTQFILGCSSRYSHWKNIRKCTNKGMNYLFVGALAEFDNKVLILAIDNLLSATAERIPIRLRLHPAVQLRPWMRGWIRNKARKHEIELSVDKSLREDLKRASVVIGMSTTVLEEAVLLGRPVIQITHPDYLQFIDIDGIDGIIKKSYRDISVNDLVRIACHEVESSGMMRDELGLDHPEVTYKRLFAP